MVNEEVEYILMHSQDYPFDLKGVDKLIEQWRKAKEPFIKMFGGKTFVRSTLPIKVSLSPEQRSRKFSEFLLALDDEGCLNKDFEKFLCDNRQSFFENRVSVPYPDYDIKVGSKILKSFKKFQQENKKLRSIQDMASRYIQENKVEGYLYLSVDPKDFLTLSENNANWYSCQSLDRDYRAGSLSYMVDNTTIVAYLADDKKAPLKCFPANIEWYSKKWRMLLHWGEHCIYYNRQYPYASDELLDKVHKAINKYRTDILTPPLDVGYNVIRRGDLSTILVYSKMGLDVGRSFEARDIINTDNYNGYCDLIYSNSYAPIAAVDKDMYESYIEKATEFETPYLKEFDAFSKMFRIKIGERPICPLCGEDYITREDKFLCDMCIAENDADEDFFLACEDCGCHIYDSDPVYFINDFPYCKACYDEMKEDEQ